MRFHTRIHFPVFFTISISKTWRPLQHTFNLPMVKQNSKKKTVCKSSADSQGIQYFPGHPFCVCSAAEASSFPLTTGCPREARVSPSPAATEEPQALLTAPTALSLPACCCLMRRAELLYWEACAKCYLPAPEMREVSAKANDSINLTFSIKYRTGH